MAKLKNGILGPLIGKLANLVGYERFGQAVVRMAPRKTKKKKPRSDAQKAVNLRFKIVKSFIAEINPFVNVGFRQDVAGTTKIPETERYRITSSTPLSVNIPICLWTTVRYWFVKGNCPGLTMQWLSWTAIF